MRADVVVRAVQGPSAAEIAQMQREAMQVAREQMQAQREQARAQAEAARAQAEAARAQARAGVLQQSPDVAGGRGNVSVVRDGAGRTIVQTGDGRTITIDPSAVPSLQGQEAIIREALSAVPPVLPRDRGPAPSVVLLAGLALLFLTLMVVGFPLARAWARRMDRRTAGGTVSPDLDARLQRIEHAVDAIAVEVERVSEGQRFATRLLAERAEAEGVSAVVRERVPAR